MDHFRGELQFDAFSRFGIRFQVVNAVVRRSGSTLHWAIERPDDIVDAVPGVRPLVVESVFEAHGFEELAPELPGHDAGDVGDPGAAHDLATYHRYAF